VRIRERVGSVNFTCPWCTALYQVIKTEAQPNRIDPPVACGVCGGQLPGRDGKLVLKYFLLRKAARLDPRKGR